MIYALIGLDVSEADRQAVAQAISSLNAAVLAQYASQDVIRHIINISEFEIYRCIWCLDRVSPSRQNRPRGCHPAAPWYFMHTTNNECIGHQMQIGVNYYGNPVGQGCYVQMGCEHVPQRHPRQKCRCIFTKQTYCHHAPNPDASEPCII